MRTTITALIAAAAGAALVLTGCGTDSAGTSSTSGASTSAVESQAQFNDADVVFLEGMYPHHAQAVQMADMVAGHTDNADVVALAAAIKAAQQPEMDRMTTWLQQWGQPVPTPDMSGMHGMNHGAGMMSADQMDALTALSGTEFDRQWLTMMIEHHEGAIDMANTELADGENPEARQMATDIVTAQQKEIADMQAALG
ncbi:DUF305 domain-containing protein [Rhodococcus opacus]|uniref:DUF305 domain-containing protein n=1 Tax=Rhodococcus opacus TaxID=37919 RepID=A0AAX3YMP7_RHOOP|nr:MULTISPECIES: DUF305 domain-containing protein [Rhodococcus]MBA8959484.1 uncharacterized protein (DUF305 family) [Rhodococcus opacus]MBP2205049.1 uncharacterized protein (DUF305 family) [Rhodococcus opacus]MCZ4582088.1 DUF305 domain-containing protein [Rhodococcus opacus]MDI9938979.1 DUF305 domain-containing protein [Rhodococcus sp. IEGM 1351]MDV6246556.1 DUF305 domain-containing protein [Rhodococcus opacus]